MEKMALDLSQQQIAAAEQAQPITSPLNEKRRVPATISGTVDALYSWWHF